MSEQRILDERSLKEIDELLEQESNGTICVDWKDGVLEDYFYTKEFLLSKKREEKKKKIVVGFVIFLAFVLFLSAISNR